MLARCVSLSFLLAIAAPAQAETFKSRVPQAHVDAFMSDCAKSNVPQASCICMLKALNDTADGQVMLDAIGLGVLRGKGVAPSQAEAAALLNRHGLKASEAKAIQTRLQPAVMQIAKNCE